MGKLYLFTVRNIYEFYLQNGGENQLAYIWNEITSLSPYVLLRAACGVACLCVLMTISHAKTAESIRMSFGGRNEWPQD